MLSTGVWVVVVVLQVLTSQLYNSLAGPFVVPKPITCQNDELVIWLQGPAADGWLCTKTDSELHPLTVSHPNIGMVARPDEACEVESPQQHGIITAALESTPLRISTQHAFGRQLDFGVAGSLTLLSFRNITVFEGVIAEDHTSCERPGELSFAWRLVFQSLQMVIPHATRGA